VLGVSASGYYAWRQRGESARRRADHGLRGDLRTLHAQSRGTYGSPRLHRALRTVGHRVGRNRVIRLMRIDRLVGRPRRRFRVTTQSDPRAVAPGNELARRFDVAVPNRVWGADITALPTQEGWLYLAVLLDLCSRRIVGWATRPTLETELVAGALHLALGHRSAPVLHHSDRGCQYASDRYQQLLATAGVRCSMSRPGNCYDNAPVESFFHTLKNEIGEVTWPSRRAATQGLADYIERFYNRERLHSSLGYRSPAQFEAALGAAI
jgi:transposase InsO family protein